MYSNVFGFTLLSTPGLPPLSSSARALRAEIKSSTPTDIMLAWLFCLATASFGLGVAQPQEHSTANATGAQSACGVELIWPPSDSIILCATDSRETQIYFKLVGDDCSAFMRTSPTAPARQGPLLGILFQNTETFRNSASFQQIVADPLDTDPTPVRIRLMRSPLLAKMSMSMSRAPGTRVSSTVPRTSASEHSL